ncbi:hypothetical protein [Iodobacter violaceini]|uniref:hypothetical protein n=1 Tax=Iodobacter violaceini TaxID=3044271 RepID=UPI001F0F09DA|nr:hypothetical protein [Iodobacter violacea]
MIHVVVGGVAAFAFFYDLRQRYKAVGFKQVMTCLFSGFFQGDDVAVPNKFCLTLSVFFADAAAEYVVEVFGFARLAADFAQAVEAIPAEFSDLLALLLFNQIAAGVVFVMGFGVLLKIIGVGKELNPLRAKESRINFTLTPVIPSMQQIAMYFCVHYSTVCRIIKRDENRQIC